MAIFDNLEKTTRPLFEKMKAELDAELADRFGVPADQLMPRHYDNPFFQQAPPSKPHFVIAPVYYHNYMMGELFAAQIRGTLDMQDNIDFGKRLQEKVFAPGMRYGWQEFVRQAKGRSPKSAILRLRLC